MSVQSEEIADEFFDKEAVTTVDFEITLAALLATATITYPVAGRAWLGRIIAFSLLVVTLVRRLVLRTMHSAVSNSA